MWGGSCGIANELVHFARACDYSGTLNTSLPTRLLQTGYAEDGLSVTSLDRGFASVTNCQRFNRGISLCCQRPGASAAQHSASYLNQSASEIARSALRADNPNSTNNFTGITVTDTCADTRTKTAIDHRSGLQPISTDRTASPAIAGGIDGSCGAYVGRDIPFPDSDNRVIVHDDITLRMTRREASMVQIVTWLIRRSADSSV